MNQRLDTLNRDIWRPFAAAYAVGDAEAYLDLHTPDLVRVDANTGSVLDFESYAKGIREFFASMADTDVAMCIEFRFVERLADGDLASERGVFKFRMTRPGHQDRVRFGVFHTIARRTGGRWRLSMDYDSPSDEDAFNAVKAS